MTSVSMRTTRPRTSSILPDGSVRRRVVENWHCLEAVLPQTTRRFSDMSPEGLLALNSLLPAAVKFAVLADGQTVLRAELPCNLHNIESEIADVSASFEGAIRMVGGRASVPVSPNRSSSDTPESGRALQEASAAAGLETVIQPNGDLVVSLSGSPEARQAHFSPLPGDGWQVRTKLTSLSGVPDVSRHAISVFLLRLAARLRWARPALGNELVLLEIQSPTAAEPSDLKDALACLAFACSRFSPATRALLDEAAARLFSEVVVWTAPKP